MQSSLTITKKDVFRYAVLPGIVPRIARLARGGFYNLSFLIASVFNALKILPSNHPYLRADAMGTYGIVQVIAQAANHIEFKKENWDKILVFFSILAGLVILVLQFVLIIISVVFSPALAASDMPTDYAGFFVTQNNKTDLVFKTLDRVFGIPKLFDSEVMAGGPTPMNLALQALFEFYSVGLLFVGFFIIIYFVITIVAETAQTGTPFGKRFSHVWAPVRLVIFFALLIPVTSGLNGGQILTLWAAKYGSGLATNGWITFTNVLYGAKNGKTNSSDSDETLAGKKEQVIARPNVPELAYLPGFMLVAKTCQYVEKDYGHDVDGYVVYGPISEKLAGANLQNIIERNKGTPVYIRFGVQDQTEFTSTSGTVGKECGELTMNIGTIAEPGAAVIQNAYFDLVKRIWSQSALGVDQQAERINKKNSTLPGNNPKLPGLTPNYFSIVAKGVYNEIDGKIEEAVKKQIEDGGLKPDAKISEYGWGGAAIWYNQIAKQNGALTEAINSPPTILHMPEAMEQARAARLMSDMNLDVQKMYTPFVKAGDVGNSEKKDQNEKARIMNIPYEAFASSGFRADALSFQTKLTGNVFIDTINLLLGTRGLFDLCKNVDIHPLAQMSSVGKSLIENSIRSFSISIFAGAAGGIASLIEQAQKMAPAAFSFASFFVTVAGIGLMIGFILFYVVPFMPFIYFFFAVADWVKGLFEAMVGVPLWALAHLRIDGEGMSGEAASGGYFLIFEIFVRPILIIAGLLAAVTIFSAMVKVMNEIFYIMVGNLTGNDPESSSTCFSAPSGSGDTGTGGTDTSSASYFRGPVDEFFYTVMYAIIVYLIGMSSFKLIDMIPDNILRWMNAGVSGFSDKSGDPAEDLLKYVAVGGGGIGEKLQSGMSGVAGNVQKALASAKG